MNFWVFLIKEKKNNKNKKQTSKQINYEMIINYHINRFFFNIDLFPKKGKYI